MPSRSLTSSVALAAFIATVTLTAAPQAQAQGLFEFLWGGGQEWGGGKQTVSFDPKYTAGQVIVSFGDRRLYLITKSGTALSYPIAVPREQSRWQGTTSVTDKRENPSWRPTPEMLRENPKLPLWVPGGHRMNPLGVRALYLGSSMYRIHGTDAPWTIGQAVSKGCIRMLNEDVLDVYPRIPVGTKVTVTWQRFSSQAIASDDSAPSYQSAAVQTPFYKSPGRTIRSRTPAASVEAVADTTDMDAAPVDPKADEATLAAAAEKPLETAKPVKKAEVHKKPAAAPVAHVAPVAAHQDIAAVAEKAAAAATRAAEAARAAADAAKKAAEDAKKAAETPAGKSASL
ncbi:MAG: L,D-transpeptidase [Hyphomicrobium sp.]|jgi:lipoprotein-anchoring transpeptidase ErfK/SrfK